jgi:hypothetical protein
VPQCSHGQQIWRCLKPEEESVEEGSQQTQRGSESENPGIYTNYQ